MPRRTRAPATTKYWIGYPRKSTDTEDKQVHSLGDQATMIREYYERLPASEKERRPLRILEEAHSAYRPGRPVFNTILQLASQGRVHGVIVVHPNRVSRNHADSGSFVQRLVDGQIACLDTTGGKRYTGADSNDIFMLTLEGAMSWKDSRDKGDRIRQAMRMRAAEGRHMGPVQVGYRSVCRPDGTKVLEVVPETAPLLRHLFALAATGTYSVQDLVAEARKIRLACRSGKAPAKGALHRILRDPLYKGFVRFDGVVARGRHEPIVEEGVWERVQEVLTARCRNTPRPKDPALRELFFFGNLLACPRCGRSLCPYRVKGRYVYYECKNPETRCRVLAPQPALVEQLTPLLQSVSLDPADLEGLRGRLLDEHRRRSGEELGQRDTLNAEYERVVEHIGDVFAQRGEAAALGVLAEVDARLTQLRRRRDELQGQLNACHEEGDAWIEKVVRCFELIELLQEAMNFGSARCREMVLRGVASNYSVEGKTLVWEPRAPFRQAGQKGVRPDWSSALYDVRTEISGTVELLQSAWSAFQAARIALGG
jgi:DNA invertase Pin-like site-specific DNA recombinase